MGQQQSRGYFSLTSEAKAMNVPISATRLRATLLDVVERVRNGMRVHRELSEPSGLANRAGGRPASDVCVAD